MTGGELRGLFRAWREIVLAGHKGITFSELLRRTSLNEEDLVKILDRLHALYMIEYLPSRESREDILLRKRYILGNPLDDLPCLGCPLMGSCTIGGEGRTVENCDKFSHWLKNFLRE